MESVSICIPFHLRGHSESQAYAIAFKHYASLPYTVHLCGSEGDASRNFASRFTNDTTHYIEVPQSKITTSSSGDDTLRKKFNDSLRTLPDSDWYCLCGADDIVPSSFFEWLSEQDPNGVIMAGQSMGSQMYLHNCETGERSKITLNYKVELKLTGGVNAFSRDAMQRIIFEPYQLKGCETGAEMLMASIGKIIHKHGYVVMPKENFALNGYEKLLKFHTVSQLTDEDNLLMDKYISDED